MAKPKPTNNKLAENDPWDPHLGLGDFEGLNLGDFEDFNLGLGAFEGFNLGDFEGFNLGDFEWVFEVPELDEGQQI
jgi:hypothetical protein